MIRYYIVSSQQERQLAYDLRIKIFVDEQGVPLEMELDEFDETATHVIASENDQVIGTGRLVIEGNCGRIGRMAVLKEKRGLGIGKTIISLLEDQAKDKKVSEIYLHAQTHAQEFYARLGYIPRGDVFDEAGIDHIEMYKLTS